MVSYAMVRAAWVWGVREEAMVAVCEVVWCMVVWVAVSDCRAWHQHSALVLRGVLQLLRAGQLALWCPRGMWVQIRHDVWRL